MSQTIGLDVANSRGTQVDQGANDTKGSYTTLGIASQDFQAVKLQLLGVEVTSRFIFDVRISGVAEIAKNILYLSKSSTAIIACNEFTIYYPGSSGDVIQVRHQTDNAANRFLEYCGYLTNDIKFNSGTVSDSYGADLVNTNGMIIEPSGILNTESRKYEFTTVSGLSNNLDSIAFFVYAGGIVNIGGNNTFILKIYTGSTGDDFSGLSWVIKIGSNIDHPTNPVYQTFVDRTVFSAGTRVWVSVQANTIDSDDRLLVASMTGYQVTEAGSVGGSTNVLPNIHIISR